MSYCRGQGSGEVTLTWVTRRGATESVTAELGPEVNGIMVIGGRASKGHTWGHYVRGHVCEVG